MERKKINRLKVVLAEKGMLPNPMLKCSFSWQRYWEWELMICCGLN